MDGWNYILLYALVASFVVPFLARVITPLRALWIAGSWMGIVFVLALIGWFSVELAILMALPAAIVALVGAGFGALILEWRGKQ